MIYQRPLPGPRSTPWGSIVIVTAIVAALVGAAAAAFTVWVAGDEISSPSAVCQPTGGVLPFDAARVIEAVAPSVVAVRVTYRAAGDTSLPVEGLASGFVADGSGHIVTNEHVIAGASRIQVSFSDGQTFPAELLGADAELDIAVLQVAGTNAVPLSFGQSSPLRPGDPVMVVSHWRAPEGGPSASLGIISATGRDILTAQGRAYIDLLQTDAAMGSGDSGGPLVDASGHVIGVVVAGSVTGQCVGFAIPIDTALREIERIIRSTGGQGS